MLLRRITKHVSDQNWFAVFIDFLIVVVGILIAFQITNWSETQQDAVRANEYLGRLQNDLVDDARRLDNRIARWSNSREHGVNALNFARMEDLTSSETWDAISHFFMASFYLPFFSTDVTFEEMKSSGTLSLITDAGLRDEIASYYQGVERAQGMYKQENDYRNTIRAITPIGVQNHFRHICKKEQNAIIKCDPILSGVERRNLLDSYIADPNIVRNLRIRVFDLDQSINIAKRDKAATEDLIAKLKSEIK